MCRLDLSGHFVSFDLCPVPCCSILATCLLSRDSGGFLLCCRQHRLLTRCALGTMQIVIDIPDMFLALIELLSCGDTTVICETARDS